MLRSVIFDMDGVLLEFNLDSKMIKGRVIGYFEKRGMANGALSPEDPFSQIKDAVRSHFEAAGKSVGWIDGLIADAEKIPISYEIEAAKSSKLCLRAIETLTALRSRDLKLGVFTYNNHQATEIALKKHGIDKFFECVITRDMVDRPKPNPIHLNKVLSCLGVNKDEALVVGDSEMDIKPSKELGVRVVAVTTGIRDSEFLRSYNPEFMISDLSEVVRIVDSINKYAG